MEFPDMNNLRGGSFVGCDSEGNYEDCNPEEEVENKKETGFLCTFLFCKG